MSAGHAPVAIRGRRFPIRDVSASLPRLTWQASAATGKFPLTQTFRLLTTSYVASVGGYEAARPKRSRFITLFQAAMKSWTNFFSASELP